MTFDRTDETFSFVIKNVYYNKFDKNDTSVDGTFGYLQKFRLLPIPLAVNEEKSSKLITNTRQSDIDLIDRYRNKKKVLFDVV